MKPIENFEDHFGFLPEKWFLKFDNFEITPLDDYDSNKQKIENSSHLIYDGNRKFIFSPSLFSLPSSHRIVLSGVNQQDTENLRRTITGFIVNLLGYLFGRRFQFEGWWYDSRVPLDNHHNLIFSVKDCESFLNHSVREWRSWRAERQARISNLLFMHSRAISYQWDWEKFMIEYAVFDGIWRSFAEKTKITEPKHHQRLTTILTYFKMTQDKSVLNRIIDLRNDLFHETLWDKGQPCTARSSDAFHSYFQLRRIVERLIPAILGYQTKYISSNWLSKSPDRFS